MHSCWKPCAITLRRPAAWRKRIGRARPSISTGWPNGSFPLPRSTARQAASPGSVVSVSRVEIVGLEGPDATVHGTMTVTDPTAFARLLAHGVGRHRAYGYGMLLLRPPGAARRFSPC